MSSRCDEGRSWPGPLAVVLTGASAALRRVARDRMRRGVLTADTDLLVAQAAALTVVAMMSERPDGRAELDRARAAASEERREASLARTLVCDSPPPSREDAVWIEDEDGRLHYVEARLD